MIEIIFDRENNRFLVNRAEDVTSLVSGCYGYVEHGEVVLAPEEVLYLMDIRNAVCYDKAKNRYSFNEVAGRLRERKDVLARYFTYKDWRDRGLIPRPVAEAEGNYGKSGVKKYKSSELKIDRYVFNGLFFDDDLITIIDDEKVGRELYEKYWFGQFGTYKADSRGKLSKLDVYETLFLMRHAGLLIENRSFDEIMKIAEKRINFFSSMYDVYEDWRLRGFVLKTGFKFGTHFRIYFPGANPTRKGSEWMHSKHVVHVFPRMSKMLISEWARALRVAHSVRKTFILAIPGKKLDVKVDNDNPRLDFLLYHRKKNGIEKPKEGNPKYLMFSLCEDEYLGGEELAMALWECKHYGLEMLMAIADRESSVTYYLVRRIEMPGSKYDYFEIEWTQP